MCIFCWAFQLLHIEHNSSDVTYIGNRFDKDDFHVVPIFTDTRAERNALMALVYPKLREYCRERGYDFQVVDMRWGVRDEATDDHMTSELCMRELRKCQKFSTGPNFIVSELCWDIIISTHNAHFTNIKNYFHMLSWRNTSCRMTCCI